MKPNTPFDCGIHRLEKILRISDLGSLKAFVVKWYTLAVSCYSLRAVKSFLVVSLHDGTHTSTSYPRRLFGMSPIDLRIGAERVNRAVENLDTCILYILS